MDTIKIQFKISEILVLNMNTISFKLYRYETFLFHESRGLTFIGNQVNYLTGSLKLKARNK